MLARVFEANGLSTVQLSLLREHSEPVRAPRALFCAFPFGRALGRPNDPAFQHRVLAAAFALLDRPSGPVLEDFPEEIAPDGAPAGPAAERPADPAFELTGLRPYYRRFVARQGGRTAVGLAGVPADRLRGLVRLLERYADGRAVDPPQRPPETSLEQYLRFACDDLKAFYREARLERRPDEAPDLLEAWFWRETALGGLIVRVRDRMVATGDAQARAIAYGIARV